MIEQTASGLTDMFTNAAKHAVGPMMIFMMVSMALPGMAAAAPVGGATLGDVGLATLKHYGTMLTAPFTEAGVIGDVIGNAINGNFAPNPPSSLASMDMLAHHMHH